MDGGAWWAVVHGIAKNRTRLSDFTFTMQTIKSSINNDYVAIQTGEGEAPHSSTLAWKIPWTEEAGWL